MTPEQFDEHRAMMLEMIQWQKMTYEKLELVSLVLLQAYMQALQFLDKE